MEKFGLFYYKDLRARKLVYEVKEWLKNKGIKAVINKTDGIDFAVIFGGDGTILHTANRIAEEKRPIPIIRVNLGTRGFLANVEPEDVYDRLEDFLNRENCILVERSRIMVSLKRGEESTILGDALNEAFVDRVGVKALRFTLQEAPIFHEKNKIPLCGDGILFSTPTGATAYYNSAGGSAALKKNEMGIKVICSTSDPWSKIVPLNETTRFLVAGFGKNQARLVIDGKMIMKPDSRDILVFRKSDKKTIFVEFGDRAL
ncbi:MAG: NAD(+)/NADH kinase [Candidatus Paceibacterota bacterium]